MAFPDPENYSLDGEVTRPYFCPFSKTATAVGPYIPYSFITIPREYSLEGSVDRRFYTNAPDTGGGDCDDRPNSGMLYPRG
jgi:hypothetical protein